MVWRAWQRNIREICPAEKDGRAAIVRAFVHEPLLVVADEPTSDLDEENTKIILDYFERKRKAGTAILISTHDLSCLRPGVTHYRMDHGVIRSRTEI